MIEELRERLQGKRALILGIGNTMRGDDGLGPALIERLQGKVAATLIDAGEVPENYLGPIEAAGAEVILIVDAADLRAAAGDVALIELEQLGKTGISTHNASLGLFASVVQRLTGADILVLAVQPMVNAFGAPMSEEVGRTLDRLEEMLSTFLRAPGQR
jgi:hydrogenase 3 maturation protease